MAAFEASMTAGGEEAIAAKDLFNVAGLADERDFYYMLADSASMAVQYGSKEDMCIALQRYGPDADPEDLRVQFANFTKAHYGENFGADCFYDTECLRDDDEQWQPTARAWRW